MASANATLMGTTEILLLQPKTNMEDVQSSMTQIFPSLSELNNYVSNNTKNTAAFILFVSENVIQQLINDGIHNYFRVRCIYVFCDDNRVLNEDQQRSPYGKSKLRFLHERNLREKIKTTEYSYIISSSTAIDQDEKHTIASEYEQRVARKRSRGNADDIRAVKRLDITSENAQQTKSSAICPGCQLFIRIPYQLICGHRVCQPCTQINDNEMTCPTCYEISPKQSIWFDRAFLSELEQLSVTCLVCHRTGPLAFYQNLKEQAHSNRMYNSVNSHQLEGQAGGQEAPEDGHSASPFVQQEMENITSTLFNADAQSRKQNSIYSEPFYSSRNGYKMRLRLYLNGDGDVRGSHVSLFLVIMRGDNDKNLQWPFAYKITFSLLDQSTPGDIEHDIVRHLWSDPVSSCCQRPICDMNAGYGLKRFVSLEHLQKNAHLYIQNDSIFLKVTVDLSAEAPELPTTVEKPYDDGCDDILDEDIICM